MSWLCVSAGRCEEQLIKLRNETNANVVLNVIVRESSAFKIGGSDSVTRLAIPPLATVDFAVTYAPPNEFTGGGRGGCDFDSGKLVLKPVGGVNGRTVKASIPLQGTRGRADVRLEAFGALFNKRRTLTMIPEVKGVLR